MPCLLVLHSGSITVTLLRMDMHYGGTVSVLHATEHLNELSDVVALLQVFIVEAPRLKPVVLAHAVALAQRTKVLVYSSVVLGYGHLVVVHNDDDARAKLRRLVKSFESLAARQRSVADNGNDVLLRALHVACLLQSRGKADGCGGMSHLKVVVLRTLRRRRISRYGVHVVHVAEESCSTSCQHLMRITLVADVKHQLVLRCIKDVMQCHRSLHETKVGSHVSAMLADTIEHSLTCLVSHNVKCLDVHALKVGRCLYLLYIHIL